MIASNYKELLLDAAFHPARLVDATIAHVDAINPLTAGEVTSLIHANNLFDGS